MGPCRLDQSLLEIRRLSDKLVVKTERRLLWKRGYPSIGILLQKSKTSILHSLSPMTVIIFVSAQESFFCKRSANNGGLGHRRAYPLYPISLISCWTSLHSLWIAVKALVTSDRPEMGRASQTGDRHFSRIWPKVLVGKELYIESERKIALGSTSTTNYHAIVNSIRVQSRD